MDDIGQEKYVAMMMEQLFYFYNATDIPVQLLDDSGNVLQSFQVNHKYCRLAREVCAKRAFCEKIHTDGCKQAHDLKEGYIFSCPGELIHFVIPITLWERRYSILAGPVALDYPDVEVVDSLLQRYNCSLNYRNKLYAALGEVYMVEPVRLQYLCQLLFSMMRNLTEKIEALWDEKKHRELPKQNISPILEKAVHYMEQHFRENLRLDDVAGYVGLNPSYFSSIFKKGLSISFSQYVMQLRIDEACRMLRQTDDPLVDIALQLGFENQSYFSMSFKKYVGLSPNQYRRQKDGDGYPA